MTVPCPLRGQSRHFDRAPLTSGTQLADILRLIRHVSKVPILLQKSFCRRYQNF
jgi:hypothetical protein